ncbi:larval cuticle protein 1-like isoform X1 [Coccinella septempunctata]|uniref:larval cuticle protein 1-like isoform X1 n=1 Tax=Coccinella septempunctata TaxID=41139 RepID=UPI001D090002|nr:larval cuticle protein 1-like isoform X1 [Coccinella septempunctata]
MKWILSVLFTLVTSVMSVPVVNDADATITSYDYQLRENGYSFSYSTSNGITRQENAFIIGDPNRINDDNQIIIVNGFYSYTDKDNNMYRVEYVADENGYRVLEKTPLSAPSGGFGAAGGYSGSAGSAPLGPTYQSIGQSQSYSPQEPKPISSAALASLGGSS